MKLQNLVRFLNMELILAMCLALGACTMFRKTQGSQELESLTEDVLKRHQGIEIDVRPLPNQR